MNANDISQIETLKTNPEAVENTIRCLEAIQEIVTRTGNPAHVVSKEEAKAIVVAVVKFPHMSSEKIADFVTQEH